MQEFSKERALHAPILVLGAYLAFTVGVFFFGPVDWYVPSKAKLFLFLFVNYFGLWAGYRRGIRKAQGIIPTLASEEVGAIRVRPAIVRLAVFSMIFNIVSTLVRLHALRGLDTVVATIMRPGEAYRETQILSQLSREGALAGMRIAEYSWAFRISTVLSVFTALYFPLGLACWSRMRAPGRIVFCGSVICTLVFTIGMGAQSGVGFLMFAALPFAMYKYFFRAAGNRPQRIGDRRDGLTRNQIRLLATLGIVVLASTIVFFQVDRQEAGRRTLDAQRALVGPYGVVSDDGLFDITGDRLRFGLIMTSLYISQGYEGLALAMELPFEWTFGVGWSKALQSIYHDYLGGSDIFVRSYLARNEAATGWPALRWWSTIFTWIASDTTFYGTVLVMFFIGFCLARVWGDAISSGNPFAFAVLAQLFILVFMFPANNALAQTLDALFAVVGILSIYALSRKHFRSYTVSRNVTSGQWESDARARLSA